VNKIFFSREKKSFLLQCETTKQVSRWGSGNRGSACWTGPKQESSSGSVPDKRMKSQLIGSLLFMEPNVWSSFKLKKQSVAGPRWCFSFYDETQNLKFCLCCCLVQTRRMKERSRGWDVKKRKDKFLATWLLLTLILWGMNKVFSALFSLLVSSDELSFLLWFLSRCQSDSCLTCIRFVLPALRTFNATSLFPPFLLSAVCFGMSTLWLSCQRFCNPCARITKPLILAWRSVSSVLLFGDHGSVRVI